MASSRGVAISGYSPAFSKGAKVYKENIASGTITSAQVAAATLTAAKLKKSVVSGTIANSGVVYAVSHGLGATPSVILITTKGTVGQLKASATSANSVGLASVSAATSASVYVAGAKNTHFNVISIL